MPRHHKKHPGSRKYNSCSEEELQNTNIRKGTLVIKIHKNHGEKFGRQLFFFKEEEDTFRRHIFDKLAKKVPQFGSANLSGVDWARGFLKRQNKTLVQRFCHLTENGTANGRIPPERIFNYDETNLYADPGVKICLFKCGIKYPERVKDSSKSSSSVMFCGTASGHLLPPYVEYKAEHLWEIWMDGGSNNTKYNRSRSGCTNFLRLVSKCVFLPHAKKLGCKIARICDNLASHFSPEKYWRQVLNTLKDGQKRKSQSITKDVLPKLLKAVYEKVCNTSHGNMLENLKASFRKSDICPFNPRNVIDRLPDAACKDLSAISRVVSDGVLQLLKQMRHSDGDHNHRSHPYALHSPTPVTMAYDEIGPRQQNGEPEQLV
ncbi:hypothetical protein PR048_020791 [Dryococelus australis]|uniref:DDE-1 domain-containing protein n=1 Tax=Dryococelus australis TaxID=614101 RepID=A0ABQ9GWE0_9NEOP|nr:hypothetical protein PR048_020791 [Dryococelus australis]